MTSPRDKRAATMVASGLKTFLFIFYSRNDLTRCITSARSTNQCDKRADKLVARYMMREIVGLSAAALTTVLDVTQMSQCVLLPDVSNRT